MSERSLFNVACKILGLWVVYSGLVSLFWAFLASRFSDQTWTAFNPSEIESWFFGGTQTVFGLLLCGRSSWLTRLLFSVDGPLEGPGTERNWPGEEARTPGATEDTGEKGDRRV